MAKAPMSLPCSHHCSHVEDSCHDISASNCRGSCSCWPPCSCSATEHQNKSTTGGTFHAHRIDIVTFAGGVGFAYKDLHACLTGFSVRHTEDCVRTCASPTPLCTVSTTLSPTLYSSSASARSPAHATCHQCSAALCDPNCCLLTSQPSEPHLVPTCFIWYRREYHRTTGLNLNV